MMPILGIEPATLVGGSGCSHHCTITALQEIANQKLYLEVKFCQQQYYSYFQVNGTLVTHFNHAEVVDLIKSGSYVALTLLGKPPAHLHGMIIVLL